VYDVVVKSSRLLSHLLMSFLPTSGDRKQKAEVRGFLRTRTDKQIWMTTIIVMSWKFTRCCTYVIYLGVSPGVPPDNRMIWPQITVGGLA